MMFFGYPSKGQSSVQAKYTQHLLNALGIGALLVPAAWDSFQALGQNNPATLRFYAHKAIVKEARRSWALLVKTLPAAHPESVENNLLRKIYNTYRTAPGAFLNLLNLDQYMVDTSSVSAASNNLPVFPLCIPSSASFLFNQACFKVLVSQIELLELFLSLLHNEGL